MARLILMKDEVSFSDSGKQQFSLVGGFLGAGKTSLVGKYARWLQEKGLRVALVTNDQGDGLLDTASAREALGGDGSTEANKQVGQAGTSQSVDARVSEITGGCFCCRLDELVNSINELDEQSRPDVIVAEPVGSCTDLMATVLRPLEQVYHTPFALSPLAVVLDARRALASLGGKRSKRDFHRDVGYIYRKQMEEAEWLVVNKADLLDDRDLADLLARIEKDYHSKRVFVVSAKTGLGLEEWFQATLDHVTQGGRAVEIDYERYAEGEALLGWVNSEASCEFGETVQDLDWGHWLHTLGKAIGDLLDAGGHEVGHFKMSVDNGEKIYRVHQVMGGTEVEEGVGVSPSSKRNQIAVGALALPCLLINLRAEGDAKTLEGLVARAIGEQTEVTVTFRNQAAFQPGKPVPIHRIAAA